MVARGHRVVVTDLDGEGAARTASEIGAAEGLAQDVRDAASHRSVAAAAARHGVLTAWFNNAGVAFDQDLADLTDEQVQATVEVNLLGVMWGTRAAIDAFGDAGGDIVVTASLSALGPVPNLSAYAATKAAVLSLTTSVNLETPRNVRLHAVCPDGVATPMLEGMVGGHGREARALRRPGADHRRGRRGGRGPDRLAPRGAHAAGLALRGRCGSAA